MVALLSAETKIRQLKSVVNIEYSLKQSMPVKITGCLITGSKRVCVGAKERAAGKTAYHSQVGLGDLLYSLFVEVVAVAGLYEV